MTQPDPHCRLKSIRIKRAPSSRILLPFNQTTAMLVRLRADKHVNSAHNKNFQVTK